MPQVIPPYFFTRLLAGVCLLLYGAAGAAADKHMGVASCASSSCHGSTRPFTGSAVRQDEYFIWQRQDRHAHAFETLRGERSQRIAENLGFRNAAETVECLACHSDAVPAAQRARGHQLGDGVGCEACHGGAERWLAPHVAGFKTDVQRRQAGMFPVWEVATRARLCLSCHQGDVQRPITHLIMSAGHPPLRFELDTFSSVMPAHYTLDADYIQRKGPQDGARNWLIGQIEAVDLLLENLSDAPAQKGLFPELVFFDCNACHHSLNTPRWQPGIAATLAPGSVRLTDSALKMAGYWLDGSDAVQSKRWHAAVAQLHSASQENAAALQNSARALRELLKNEVLPRASSDPLDATTLKDLLKRIVREHRDGPAGNDFSSAEQATMAVAVLFTALSDHGGAKLTPDFKAALDALFATVQDRDRFVPAEFRKAMARADSALPKTR